MQHSEGARVLTVGASGSGKTYFSARFQRYALDVGLCDLVLCYDFKMPGRPGYEGARRGSVEDFRAHPLDPGEAPIVVFNDARAAGDPEAVAQLGLDCSDAGMPTLVQIDELFPDAVKEGGSTFIGGRTGPLATVLRTGRSRRCSLVVGTQLPQEMPTTLMDLCDHTAIFRMQGRSLDYVEARVPREAIEVVRNLRRGEFVLMSEGAWNGRIYGPA